MVTPNDIAVRISSADHLIHEINHKIVTLNRLDGELRKACHDRSTETIHENVKLISQNFMVAVKLFEENILDFERNNKSNLDKLHSDIVETEKKLRNFNEKVSSTITALSLALKAYGVMADEAIQQGLSLTIEDRLLAILKILRSIENMFVVFLALFGLFLAHEFGWLTL